MFDQQDDSTRLFGEMKNLQSVWAGHAQRGPGTGPAPWLTALPTAKAQKGRIRACTFTKGAVRPSE